MSQPLPRQSSVVVYEDNYGQWHWRLVENGLTVEASRSRFVSKASATAVAEMHARDRAAGKADV